MRRGRQRAHALVRACCTEQQLAASPVLIRHSMFLLLAVLEKFDYIEFTQTAIPQVRAV